MRAAFATLFICLSLASLILANDRGSGPAVTGNKMGLPPRHLQEVDPKTPTSKGASSLKAKKLAVPNQTNSSTKDTSPKDLCAAVKNFIKKESEITEELIPNHTNICTNLAKTCCTEKDFKSLENWWEGQPQSSSPQTDVLKMSRKDIRQHKQEDLLLYTAKLLSSFERMKAYALQMVSPVNKPDNFCIDIANTFKSYQPDSKIFQKQKFFSYSKKCWDFLNSLQTTILCSLCDHEAQVAFNLSPSSPNRIYLTQEGLNDFNSNCRQIFLFNVKILRPYLLLTEKLTRCTERGHQRASARQIEGETEGLVSESSLSSGEYINDLVMPTLSDFGSDLNVNLEGDYGLLVGVFKGFSEMFPETELLNATEVEAR